MECDDQNTLRMNECESVYGTTLSQESIKVIAESIGVGNFPDEAAKDLAEDVSYRLKEIIQVRVFLPRDYIVITFQPHGVSCSVFL